MMRYFVYTCIVIVVLMLATFCGYSAGEESLSNNALSRENIVNSGSVKFGNSNIYYEEKGIGIPVVLIHGGGVDCRMWDSQFDVLAQNYHVIRYDARNYGKSFADNGEYSNEDDLNALLDELKVDKAVIMGLSMGGGIAIDFTLKYPERVLALISVGAGINGAEFRDPDYEKNEVKEQEALKRGDLYEFIEWVIRSWGDGPKRTPDQMNVEVRKKIHLMMWVSYIKYNPKAKPQPLKPYAITRLHEIKVPTLSITGDIDMSVIHRMSDSLVQKVPNAKHVSVKNVAHYVNMEAPDEFNKIVLDFLAKLQ